MSLVEAHESRAAVQTAVANVEYEQIDGAQKAIHNMHNVEYCQRTIKVEYFDAAGKSNPDPGSSARKTCALLMPVTRLDLSVTLMRLWHHRRSRRSFARRD